MAIEWFDSLQHYTHGSGVGNNLIDVYGAGGVVASGIGWFLDTSALGVTRDFLSHGGGSHAIRAPVTPAASKWLHTLFGAASGNVGGGDGDICAFREVGGTVAQHVTITVSADWGVTAKRGTNTGAVLGASAPNVLTPNALHSFGVEVAVHDSAGAVRVLVDGHEVLALTNVDTRNGGDTGVIDQVQIGCFANVSGFHWGQFGCGDTSGSAPANEVPAFLMSGYLPADGAGDAAQFTPNAGTNFSRVSQTAPDDDTTYNQSDTIGHRDSFTVANLPDDVGQVLAVRAVSRERKVGTGASDLDVFVRLDGDNTDYLSHAITQVETYVTRKGPVMATNPSTSAPWEIADVNDMEVGYEKTA